MNDVNGPWDPKRLLEERAWAVRLARSLVDADAAEDVAQEAMIAALDARPLLLRAWLSRVVSNLARQTVRRQTRRRRRERAAGQAERVAATDELVARAEVLRSVVDEVLALDPPSRDVILLRYFDDVAPREIARRLGEPPGTVRSRLKRALDRLRARIDRRYGGDRRAWTVALVGLIPTAPLKGAVAGGLLMGAKSKVGVGAALLALALVAGLSVLWVTGRSESLARRAEAGRKPSTLAPSAALPGEDSSAPARAVELVAITGRVVGYNDAPVAGAGVVARPEAPSRGGRTDRWLDVMLHAVRSPQPLAQARTGLDGSFRLEIEPGTAAELHASAAGYGTAELTGVDLSHGADGIVLRLGVPAHLRGRVVDENGNPVPGARVRFWRDGAVGIEEVATGTDGRFSLEPEIIVAVPSALCRDIIRNRGWVFPLPPVMLEKVKAAHS